MPPNNQTPPPTTPPAATPGAFSQPKPWQPTDLPTAKPTTQSARQEVVERVKAANNILVTVSTNPSVDQLTACVGLTLLLNKIGKHATAVFSGEVPSTIEFLQPEKTIEKNTDSLRDFIIALDKAKADKLRYKIEDKYVKIFITPYKTSLGQQDLEFGQGDFNVEVVMALGVKKKEELDQAITAHGRILHDATVISINNQAGSEIGAINWHESGASSLSELLVSLGESLQPGAIDSQMATAFLTGIVAETERFSNGKTSAVTMAVASQLMKAGANQQLIAAKLEKPKPKPEPSTPKPQEIEKTVPKTDESQPVTVVKEEAKRDGTLEIPHEAIVPVIPPTNSNVNKIQIDELGELRNADEVAAQVVASPPATTTEPSNPRLVLNPPTMGGTLTANTHPEEEVPNADLFNALPTDGSLGQQNNMSSSDFGSNTTNSRLFQSSPTSNLDNARLGVNNASQAGTDQKLPPIDALNAQPIDLNKPADSSGQTPGSPPPPVPPPMMPPAAPSAT